MALTIRRDTIGGKFACYTLFSESAICAIAATPEELLSILEWLKAQEQQLLDDAIPVGVINEDEDESEE